MADCKLPTSEQLEKAIRELPDKPLAVGGQGKVYKMPGPDGTCFYAAKTSAVGDSKSLEIESKILEFLKKDCEEYLLCFTGAVNVDGKFWLVTEFLKGKELFEAINDNELPTKEAMKNLVDGLAVLHRNGIAHMDIKPENIMYDHNSKKIKYIDFGLSCGMDISCAQRTNIPRGTPQYWAPEIYTVRDLVEGKRADIWSLGITMFVWITGQMPYDTLPNLSMGYLWSGHVRTTWKRKDLSFGNPYDIDLNKLICIDPYDRSLVECKVTKEPLKRTISQV